MNTGQGGAHVNEGRNIYSTRMGPISNDSTNEELSPGLYLKEIDPLVI